VVRLPLACASYGERGSISITGHRSIGTARSKY
jgi:hypothetical protein